MPIKIGYKLFTKIKDLNAKIQIYLHFMTKKIKFQPIKRYLNHILNKKIS